MRHLAHRSQINCSGWIQLPGGRILLVREADQSPQMLDACYRAHNLMRQLLPDFPIVVYYKFPSACVWQNLREIETGLNALFPC